MYFEEHITRTWQGLCGNNKKNIVNFLPPESPQAHIYIFFYLLNDGGSGKIANGHESGKRKKDFLHAAIKTKLPCAPEELCSAVKIARSHL